MAHCGPFPRHLNKLVRLPKQPCPHRGAIKALANQASSNEKGWPSNANVTVWHNAVTMSQQLG